MFSKSEKEDKLPFVSVIIPTLNRKNYLKSCLISLYNMDYPRSKFEIVVVDNGCTDGTEQLVRQDFPQVCFVLESKKGAAFARNTGSRYAKGLFMAYTDDDCIVDKNWLRNLISGFTLTKIGAVGGPVFHLHPDRVPKSLLCDRTSTVYLGDKKHFVKALVTGNLAIRREIFKKIRFDESFRFHQNEDIDFTRSIIERGYKLLYEPSAVVYHDIDRGRFCMTYIFKTALFGGLSLYLLERKRARGTLIPKFMRAFLGSLLRFFRERKVASFYWLVECFLAFLSSILLSILRQKDSACYY